MPEVMTAKEAIERSKAASKMEQEAVIKASEAAEVERSLSTLRNQLKNKREALRKVQQKEGFERLRARAIEFNFSIDKVVDWLAEMREISRQIGSSDFQPLTVTSDERELMYCSILSSVIRIRTRPAVLQEK